MDLQPLMDCQRELIDLRSSLDDALKSVEARCRAEDTEEWREWVHDGIEAGASRAHAYSRAPEPWTPTVTKIEGGAFASTPEALLGSQRDKFKGLWKPAGGPIRYK